MNLNSLLVKKLLVKKLFVKRLCVKAPLVKTPLVRTLLVKSLSVKTSFVKRLPVKALLSSILLLTLAPQAFSQLAVRGETVHTMNGPAIKDGVVLVRDGKIERVGPAREIQIPAGYKTLTARVVTPGLIDAHTVVGLSGYLNQPQDQDQLERSAPMQPELRAVDAYNSRERLIEYLRSFGVTTIHTGHAPGALISGQTMIIKTGGEVDDARAVLNQSAMIAVTLGSLAFAPQGKAPGTRSKEVALLRAELLKAGEYQAKEAGPEERRPSRDLHLDALVRVLKGEVPLLVTAERAGDILSALRVAKEFNIRIVLDGAAESYQVLEQIKAANVPVILHPTMARAVGEMENLSMETAAALRKAGITVALQSGYEGYVPKTRVVLFEAAVAASNGLSFTEALATITSDAARILGIQNRVGTLEAGKDADLALFDGDPFEYTTHITGVIQDGRVVSQEVH